MLRTIGVLLGVWPIVFGGTYSTSFLEPDGRGYRMRGGLSEISVRADGLQFDTGARVRFKAARGDARAEPENRLPGVSNYITGSDVAQWRTGVPHFGRVRFRNVYPGIDSVVHARKGSVEYDFVIAPGANAGAIGLEFPGVRGMRITASGDLVCETRGGKLVNRRPVAYQEAAGVKWPVKARFRRTGPRSARFEVGAYNRALPLVIDPEAEFTFTAGPSAVAGTGGTNIAQTLATDAQGFIYIGGFTGATTFPVSTAAYQRTNRGSFDGFILKLAPDGKTVVYSTYIGGTAIDVIRDLAVDSSGNVYVTGYTTSTNFPVTAGVIQPAAGGGNCGTTTFTVPCNDAFVAKLNAAGTSLIYSTYLGGNSDDSANGIALDNAGNVTVAGGTSSANFRTTPGAYQTTFGGGTCTLTGRPLPCQDVFVTKLNASATALVYSTFIGGSNDESAARLVADANGNAYVTGGSYSNNFPTTNGAYQARNKGGNCGSASTSALCNDAFVASVNPSGTGLIFSTLYGGTRGDFGADLARDAAGNVYVIGTTSSTDLPVTPRTQQTTYGGGNFDAFVAKFNPAGSALLAATFQGGPSIEVGEAIAISPSGAIVTSIDGPTGSVSPAKVRALFDGVPEYIESYYTDALVRFGFSRKAAASFAKLIVDRQFSCGAGARFEGSGTQALVECKKAVAPPAGQPKLSVDKVRIDADGKPIEGSVEDKVGDKIRFRVTASNAADATADAASVQLADFPKSGAVGVPKIVSGPPSCAVDLGYLPGSAPAEVAALLLLEGGVEAVVCKTPTLKPGEVVTFDVEFELVSAGLGANAAEVAADGVKVQTKQVEFTVAQSSFELKPQEDAKAVADFQPAANGECYSAEVGARTIARGDCRRKSADPPTANYTAPEDVGPIIRIQLDSNAAPGTPFLFALTQKGNLLSWGDNPDVPMVTFAGMGALDFTLLRNPAGPLSAAVTLPNGIGLFQMTEQWNFAPMGEPLMTGGRPRFISGADLDGDGNFDVVGANGDNGTPFLFFGDGGGMFRRGDLSMLTQDADAIAPAPLRPGVLDLVVTLPKTNQVGVLLNDGAGNFSTGVRIDVLRMPFMTASGDLDGDGNTDLVVGHRGVGAISVLPGDSAGGFGTAAHYGWPLFPVRLLVADVNGDELPDILGNSGASNSGLTYYLNLGSAKESPAARRRR